MATHTASTVHGTIWHDTRALDWLAPVGRALFAAIFLTASLTHFTPQGVEYAASEGVPFAELLVPLSGVVALLGGLSVVLGYKARYGAALLVAFLVPVTLIMHRFWAIPDPTMAMIERIMFMKNLGLLGGALLLVYHGAGPFSFDAHAERRDATYAPR